MLTILSVIVRIVASPASNVFQKQLTQRAADPIFIICVTHALLALICLPMLFQPATFELGAGFWTNMTVSSLLAVSGNALLVFALRSADLSLLAPINAYKSVLGLVLGIFLINEVPGPIGVAGVLLILAGTFFLGGSDPERPNGNPFALFFRERGVQLRFAALGLSATEAVFLKKAVLESSSQTTFVFWSILGFPIAAAAVALLMRNELGKQVVLLRRNARTYLWLAATTGAMQLATLVTFGKLQVGYSLALFQLSILISVFLGYRYFQEADIRKRLAGSLIMIAGATLIVVHG
jgi:drug/metabolite transporter (DMT)-like permease